MNIRVGHGYDVHRLVDDRKLILGGVEIPYEKGLLGHSDADVLIHAVCDALLGAAALGDIGKHFPDNDAKFKDIDSRILLREVVKSLQDLGYEISNVDATVIMQKPKLAAFIPQMIENIANDCGTNTDQVNVKATTEEKLGFTGDGSGAAAHAVCLILKK
ncbi:MAG: 2-C-methyl-D-erythritol 2,4-cyclodiphosphate synthase [Clostridia bacterium]|nr:2-C-methyl-D-erythritol 2,4-cyclodiphosphate synthase [Clostridia bacterium]